MRIFCSQRDLWGRIVEECLEKLLSSSCSHLYSPHFSFVQLVNIFCIITIIITFKDSFLFFVLFNSTSIYVCIRLSVMLRTQTEKMAITEVSQWTLNNTPMFFSTLNDCVKYFFIFIVNIYIYGYYGYFLCWLFPCFFF